MRTLIAIGGGDGERGSSSLHESLNHLQLTQHLLKELIRLHVHLSFLYNMFARKFLLFILVLAFFSLSLFVSLTPLTLLLAG